MIGVSLSFDNLIHPSSEELKPEVLLPKLFDRGVRSIELRTVRNYAEPDDVLKAADMLWDNGFIISVHSECKSVDSAVSDVFTPLSKLFRDLRQNDATLTIHDVPGDNALMLTRLSDYIYSCGYPAKIALENSRKTPSGSLGNDLPIVLDAVTRADRENVGVCFDMGHYAWYVANYTDNPRLLPPCEFLGRTVHTHIHRYTEGFTHYPIDSLTEPLSLYLDKLRGLYCGVYNLELEPKRFAHIHSATGGYIMSVDALKNYGISI